VARRWGAGEDPGDAGRGPPGTGGGGPGAAGREWRAGSGGRPTAGWAKPGSGGEIGPDPTDRGENGTKQSVLVEADGGPLAAVIGPAGRNAPYLLEATLSAVVVRGRRPRSSSAVVVERPEPTEDDPRRLRLDAGYDTPVGREAAASHGHTPHIRPVGEDREAARRAREASGRPPRRWVVERTSAWLNRCRALLVRHDKKARDHLGLPCPRPALPAACPARGLPCPRPALVETTA
jgi:hypothetical protein